MYCEAISYLSGGLAFFLREVVVPLAWPSVALLALLLFRSQIRDFLARVRKAGPSGVEADPATPQGISNASFEISADNRKPGLQPWLDQVKFWIEPVPNDKRPEQLMLALANANRRAFGESILRTIYGTQLKAVARLSKKSCTEDELADLYMEHRSEARDFALRTFELWIGFLIQANLVQFSGGRYELTPFGNSFYDLFVMSGFTPLMKVW